MASLNKVMLIGHLGKEPDIREGQSTRVGNMSVATDESYTDRDGNKISKTEWHRVVVYGKQAEHCQKFLRKGSLVFIEGSLKTRKWTDQNNVDRWTTEIKAQRVQFLDRKESQQGNNRPPEPPDSAYDGDPPDLPF